MQILLPRPERNGRLKHLNGNLPYNVKITEELVMPSKSLAVDYRQLSRAGSFYPACLRIDRSVARSAAVIATGTKVGSWQIQIFCCKYWQKIINTIYAC